MFLKDNLAILLLGKSLNVSDLQAIAKHPNYPNFEVRTVGSNGEVQIKFPNQGWVKPVEWAINHRNTIVNNLNASIERTSQLTDLKDVLKVYGYSPDEEITSIVSESISERLQELETKHRAEVIKSFQDGLKAGSRGMASLANIKTVVSKVDDEYHRKLDSGESVSVGMITRAIINEIEDLYD